LSGSSKAISCAQQADAPLLRIRCSVGSITAESMVSGLKPSRPSRMARSVQWPRPVSASEPYSCADTCAVRSSSPAGRAAHEARAAFIGPMVCELDGPMPILKMSKTLKLMGNLATVAHALIIRRRRRRRRRVRGPRTVLECAITSHLLLN
jgi:hypothetical protein